MQLSERISRISVSTIATILQKAEKLKHRDTKLADFGAGEPDFPTPEHIKKAAIKAIEEDFTKYTATGGIRELKHALVEHHAQSYGSNYTVEECLVTVGGKQAIFEAMSAALNEGDEVILPTPHWVTFLEIIKYEGAKPVLLETSEDENFAVHAKAIAKPSW
jgi:aspartate aminotransferase